MMHPVRGVDGYLPIAAYGMIGDCRTVALVGQDGSIDWCSLPRFDSPSVFGRLLDAENGGFWQIAPTVSYRSRQRYMDRTNILQTIFECDGGSAQVTDLMPIDAETLREHARPHDRPRLIRIVTGLAGEVTLRSTVAARPDYARAGDPLRAQDGRVHGDAADLHFCLTASEPLDGPEHEVTVRPGESVAFGLVAGPPGDCGRGVGTLEDARRAERVTEELWWGWAGRCTYDGPYEDHVVRSALTLKLMT